MVLDFDVIADFLAKANELGARGYRHTTAVLASFISNCTGSREIISLYYRDKTQKDCAFSYTSAPLPTIPDELLALLQEQKMKEFYPRHAF